MSRRTRFYYDPAQDALVRGEFTQEMAARIREMHTKGTSQRELARIFHISREKVKGIVEGRTWKCEGVMSK